MLNTEREVKRWTIIDALTSRVHDITDQEFSEGLMTHRIVLRGQFIQVENNHKIWIDGLLKK